MYAEPPSLARVSPPHQLHDGGRVPSWFTFRGNRKVLGETSAKQGGGPRTIVWVLLASLALAGVAFVIVALGWYPT